jgi:hypothetical protein
MACSTTPAVPPPSAFYGDTLTHNLLRQCENDDFDNSPARQTLPSNAVDD